MNAKVDTNLVALVISVEPFLLDCLLAWSVTGRRLKTEGDGVVVLMHSHLEESPRHDRATQVEGEQESIENKRRGTHAVKTFLRPLSIIMFLLYALRSRTFNEEEIKCQRITVRR